MGRTRKPAKVLELSGAFKKNPQRRRARLAEPTTSSPLGDPPAEWMESQSPTHAALVKIWQELVKQDVDALRVLNASHRMLVKNYCLLQHKIERATLGYGKASSGDYSTLRTYLAAMGMTPIDSAKVSEAVRVPERGAGPAPSNSKPRWGELVG